jgi:CO/xanthine dehydrogenase FAD-binding subunit
MYEPRWASPETVDEAAAILEDEGERARLVAGATDLAVLVASGEARPELLVDLGRVRGLERIDIGRAGITIGATATHADVSGHPAVRERVAVLGAAARSVGSPQIRSRGTMGGNLANGSPAADTAAALLALDSTVLVSSRTGGARKIPLSGFFSGPGETVLRPSDIVTGVAFSLPSEETRSVYIKMGQRNALAIAIVSVAVVFEPALGVVRVALGSVAPTPVRATEAEELFASRWGKGSDRETIIDEVADRAVEATRCIDDVRATGDYRRELVRVLATRALRAVCL